MGLAASCGGGGEPPRLVLLVSVDTLRADHLGCYGSERVRTPSIDALARDGVVLERCTTSAPTTLNAHTSLMTGTYGHTHGAARNGFVVAAENVTLAEVLRERGFATAGFAGAFPLHSRFGFAQGFEHYDDVVGRRSGAEVNERVLAWLDAWLDDPGGRRAFLFVHYWDVHHPYAPPPPYDRMYAEEGAVTTGRLRDIERVRRALARRAPEARRESDALRALYAGGVSWVDACLGALVEGLRERGLYGGALVVFTADHGEAMDEHWELWDHGASTYETTVHVPLVVKLPGGRRAGTRSAGLVSLVDVQPTILELLGVPAPAGVEGLSFARLLLLNGGLDGDVAEPRPPVFAEATKPHAAAFEAAPWPNALKCRAVRSGRWKLVHLPLAERLELYDLAADPAERRDLLRAPTPAALRRADELRAELEAWGAGARARAVEDASDESRRGLAALGYGGGEAVEASAPRGDEDR